MATLDLAKNGQAALQEQVDVGLQRRRHALDQRHAAVKEVARALDLELHQRDEGGVIAPGLQIGFRIAETPTIFFRQVHAIDVQVAGHVLPEVGQLQGRTDVI